MSDTTHLDPRDQKQPDTTKQCQEHGEYLAKHLFGNIWARCPTCDGERKREEEQRERQVREQLVKEAMHRMLRVSGLVGRFARATFDSFVAATADQQKVLAACKDFATGFDLRGGNSLWLIGPPGTGKTHLGSALVNCMIRERGIGAAIHGAHEISRMLRARFGVRQERHGAYDDDLRTANDLLDYLGQVPLLVLDEVGANRGSDFDAESLFTIIDARYRLERPTVLVSNLRPDELKPVLGDRAYDRLREKHQLLVCKWESHRGL